jgi:hypothetical protein
LILNKIDFILVGGFAGVVHGSTQVTRDIDICTLLTSDNIEKLRFALKEVNPRHRMNPQFKPSFLTEPKDINTKELNNIYLETDQGVLDIISNISGVGDFERIKSQAIEVPLFGSICKVISIEDLIKAKEYLGRPKDKIVVYELKQILNLRNHSKK